MRFSVNQSIASCAIFAVLWTVAGHPEASTAFLAAIFVIASLQARKGGE